MPPSCGGANSGRYSDPGPERGFLLHAPVLDLPQRSYGHVVRLPLGDPSAQRIAVHLRLARQDGQRALACQVEEARPEGSLVDINARAVWCHGRLPRWCRLIATRAKKTHTDALPVRNCPCAFVGFSFTARLSQDRGARLRYCRARTMAQDSALCSERHRAKPILRV